MLDVVARDAVFEIVCRSGVSVALLNDLPIEPGSGRLRVRLGDLVADQEVRLILAVGVETPVPLGAGIEVQCRLCGRRRRAGGEPADGAGRGHDVGRAGPAARRWPPTGGVPTTRRSASCTRRRARGTCWGRAAPRWRR